MTLCRYLHLSSGSVLGAALSLAVTTMGAGILTLPSAYADAGIIPATMGLIGVAILTVYSVDFIIVSVDKLGLNSFEELTRELLGKRAETLVRMMLLVLITGVAVSYLVVLEALLAPLQSMVMHHIPYLATTKRTLFSVWVLVILPLSCVPKIGALHGVSLLAISATSLICCMIVFRYFVPGPTPPSAITVEDAAPVIREAASIYWWCGSNMLLAMPIIMFSFGCQTLVFQLYAGLRDMRRGTMVKVSSLSMMLACTIYAAVGFFGYLSNPVDVHDNIISNYDPNVDRLFTVGYVIYTVPIILAFVLMLFPIRDSIFILWYGYSSASVATHVPRSVDFAQLVDEEEKLERITRKRGGNRRSNSSSGSDWEGTATRQSYGSIQEELEQVVEAKKHHNSIETIPMRDHLLVTVLVCVVCVLIALIVPGMVTVVAFLGGFCGGPLFFLIPGLYRWQLHHTSIAPCHSRLEWGVMLFMMFFGVFAMIFGTAVAFFDVSFS